MASGEQIDAAVAAARAAFDVGPWWNDWGPSKRARCLTKLAGLVREHRKELSSLAPDERTEADEQEEEDLQGEMRGRGVGILRKFQKLYFL